MNKAVFFYLVAILAMLTPSKANTEEDPFLQCQKLTQHDICYAAMSTYEERLMHAKNHTEFCSLATRYASLQALDSLIQDSSDEKKNAKGSLKLLISSCDEPFSGIARDMLRHLH